MLSFPSTYNSNLGQHIQENYLVRVYNEDGNFLALSVSDTTVNSIAYKGAITNVPTIRESIDLVAGKASLSNISVSVANFSFTTCGNVTLGSSTPLEEEILFGTNYYINREVRVYSQLANDSTEGNMLLLFKGRLRAVQTSENKVTLQISGHNPFKDITIPQAISENGLYSPIVFGEYTNTASASGKPLYAHSFFTETYPVQVEKVANGKVYALHADNGAAVTDTNNTLLHYYEEQLERFAYDTISSSIQTSERMAQLNSLEGVVTSGSNSPIKAQEGTVYARTTDIDLERDIKQLLFLTSSHFTVSNNHSATISVSASEASAEEETYSKVFTLENFGTLRHTPSSIVLKIPFAYSLTLAQNGTTTGNINTVKVMAGVYWKEDAAVDETFTIHTATVNGLSASLSNTYLTQELQTSSDSDNTGNMPQKIDITFEVKFDGPDPPEVGGGNNNALSGSATVATTGCIVEATTKLVLDNSTVQSDTELKNEIKELYSSDNGLQLDSETITRPLQAHRYLCETFADSSLFTSSAPADYTVLKTYFELNTAQGKMNYWLNSVKKLEDVLSELQHYGFFIGRIKADGNYQYLSPHDLARSETVSTTSPYLSEWGTINASSPITSSTDTSFTITLENSGVGVSVGDILCIAHTVASDDAFEYMKVTDALGPYTTTQAVFVERNLQPITTLVGGSYAAGVKVFKVIFPHGNIDEEDFANLQVSHTSFSDMVTKWRMNYHKNPAKSGEYLETADYTNATTRTNYNVFTEDIKEVKHPFDTLGTLSSNYYTYYNNLIGEPKLKISMDIVNPSFYSLEVGDIIRIVTTKKSPFGKNWYKTYFIITQTSRTIGKLSVSAYEIY